MERMSFSILRNISKCIPAFLITHTSVMLFTTNFLQILENDTIIVIVKFVILYN
jgi:hypothetical protein